MSYPLSDDERREHVIRATAAADVHLSLALASSIVACERASAAFRELHAAIETTVDAMVDALTPEQREMYSALLACGTLPVDALAEIDELCAPSLWTRIRRALDR